jgi:hypothetical protein
MRLRFGSPQLAPPSPRRNAPRGALLAAAIVRGHIAILAISVPAAGRVRVSGSHARSVTGRVRKASTVTLRVRLSAAGVRALQRRHRLKVRLKVAFAAPKGGGGSSHVFVTGVFR